MIIEKPLKKEMLTEDYNDSYWETRYTFREDIPQHLASQKDQILLAGKYWNVVRECGGEIPTIPPKVEVAYRTANTSLLNLLLSQHSLPKVLHSLKTYFLLSRSDFLTHFLDAVMPELRKPAHNVNVLKCQSLLEITLRSNDWHDAYKENLQVRIDDSTLRDQLLRIVSVHGSTPVKSTATTSNKQLTGLECFSLEYNVEFPLTLILTRKSMTKYQLLFRHLFQMKLVERNLQAVWQSDFHQYKKSPHPLLQRAMCIRAKMLDIILRLESHAFGEVCSKQWALFEGTKNASVDELLDRHTDFLDTCLKDCLLTDSQSVKVDSS